MVQSLLCQLGSNSCTVAELYANARRKAMQKNERELGSNVGSQDVGGGIQGTEWKNQTEGREAGKGKGVSVWR